MPAISHIKSNTIADWNAGTVTVFNSQGSTEVVNASNLVRPGDWNSVHSQYLTISGNTAGDASVATVSNLVYAATGGATVALSTAAGAATMWVSAPADNPMSEYEPISGSAVLTNSTLGQNSIYFVPFYCEDEVYVSRVNFFASVTGSMSAANATGSGGITLSAALYTRMTDSQDRMSRMWSGTFALSGSQSSNTQLVMQPNVVGISDSANVSTVNTSISDANASTYLRDSVAGYRVWAIPVNTTLGVGRYWMAVANSVTNANGTFSLNASIGQQTVGGVAQIAYKPVGTSSAASNVSFPLGMWNGAGTYSATSGGFPNSIALTSDSIRAALTLTLPYFNFSGNATSGGIL